MNKESDMSQAKQLQIPAHQRDYSLDVIKILSCVLVVLMHSRRAFDKSVEIHPILTYKVSIRNLGHSEF